jgi:ABC-type Fe3+ transport system permease subunit
MTVTDLYRVRTFAEELYTGFAVSDSAAAVSLTALPGVCAGASLATLVLAVVLLTAPALGTPPRAARTIRLGRWRLASTLLLAVLLAVIAGVPLGNLIYKAGMTLQVNAGRPVLLWSSAQLARIAGSSVTRFSAEIGWTALIGVVAAASALLAGTPLAWHARRGGWRAAPAAAIVAATAAAPGPLIGLGVIWLLDRPSSEMCIWLYDRTIFAPVLAILVRLLPLAVLMCWYVLRSVSEDVLESAATEGAGPCVRFFLIVVPQRWSGLAAVWLALLALAAGDLACSILVVPPDVTTVSVRVFGLIHAGVEDYVAGLCLTTVAAVASLAGLAGWLLRLHLQSVAGRRRKSVT